MKFVRSLFTTTPVNWVTKTQDSILISFHKSRFEIDREFHIEFWLLLDSIEEDFKDFKACMTWENYGYTKELQITPVESETRTERLFEMLRELGQLAHRERLDDAIEDDSESFLSEGDESYLKAILDESVAFIEELKGSDDDVEDLSATTKPNKVKKNGKS